MYEFISGFGIVILYFIICASSALLLRYFVHVPTEVFRKILHCILLGSLFCWILGFSSWWSAALSSFGFAVVVYPILAFLERFKGYSRLLTERKGGEIKRSLLVVFTMFTVVICVCWGYFGDRMLVLASVFAWGYGDAAAALVGKRFGRHGIKGKYVEGRKSLEGTISMFTVSFLCVLAILLVRGNMNWYGYIIVSVITAAVSAVVELYTPNGMDTITCPLAAMTVLLPLVYLFGGIV